MARRAVVIAGVAVLVMVAVGLIQAAQVRTPLKAVATRFGGYYLSGNFESREAVFDARGGGCEGNVFGTIGFRVYPGEKEALRLELQTLNLVSEGFKTEQGATGTIGLSLASAVGEVEYNPRTGEIHAPLEGTLHYELIDRIRGYRQQECKGECDEFESYVESMRGELVGKFREPLKIAEEGKTALEMEIRYELSKEILGMIYRVHVVIVVVVDWSMFQPADVLRIQPVFVGSGASDPNASGTAFNTLMNYAKEMWNRCGTVRCIQFVVNDPVYVNNNAYKTLDNSTEAVAFLGTVNVANAVEVFVARDMSTGLACSWGGGACFSGGTASAKVVSCDQQMAVPCPCPPACTGYCPCGSCLCGAINPYHLAHELGHALDLPHPSGWSSSTSTSTSVMEPSGFCCDNPNLQSAKNCRNAASPLLFSSLGICSGNPDIND